MVPQTPSSQVFGDRGDHDSSRSSSVSSYTEIDEIVTVSSYETIEKHIGSQGCGDATTTHRGDHPVHDGRDNDRGEDSETSYETITIVLSESEYETEREEIIVSDYVTDSDDEDQGPQEQRPVSDTLSTNRVVEPTTNELEKSPRNRRIHHDTTKSPSKPDEAKVPGRNSPTRRRTKNQPRKKASSSKKGSPRKDAGKRDPIMNEDDSEKEYDDEAVSDGGEVMGRPNVIATSDTDDDGDEDDPSKPKPIRLGAAAVPESPPPSPTNNEKPVARIPWKPNHFYRNSTDTTCFDAWKRYVPAERVQRVEEEQIKRRRMKRIERREYITRRIKTKERRVERIRQPKKTKRLALPSSSASSSTTVPEMIRVRKTRQIVTKKRIKKERKKEKEEPSLPPPPLPPPPLLYKEEGFEAADPVQVAPPPAEEEERHPPLSLKDKMQLFDKNKTPLHVPSPHVSSKLKGVDTVDTKSTADVDTLPTDAPQPPSPLSSTSVKTITTNNTTTTTTTHSPSSPPKKMKRKESMEMIKACTRKVSASPKKKAIGQGKVSQPVPPVADDTFDVAATSEVYVALACSDCRASPTREEFDRLAAVTKIYFTRILKKSGYRDTFEDVYVSAKKTDFECGIPNTLYNVYVEWDVRARFRRDVTPSAPDDGSNTRRVPANHDFLRTLVNSLSVEFLTDHICALKHTPFAKANAIFMEQVVKYNDSLVVQKT